MWAQKYLSTLHPLQQFCLSVYTKQLADVYNNNNQTPTTPQLSRDVQNNGVWELINGCCLLWCFICWCFGLFLFMNFRIHSSYKIKIIKETPNWCIKKEDSNIQSVAWYLLIISVQVVSQSSNTKTTCIP